MKSKEEIQEIIGLNLKRERNSTNISQFDLAIEAELHRNMIDLIEREKTMPTIFTLNLSRRHPLGRFVGLMDFWFSASFTLFKNPSHPEI